MICQLCGRDVEKCTKHHLIPKSQNSEKSELAYLCSVCHQMLNHLFSNKQLSSKLNSIEELKSHPKIRKFLKWVRKQDPNKRIKIK